MEIKRYKRSCRTLLFNITGCIKSEQIGNNSLLREVPQGAMFFFLIKTDLFGPYKVHPGSAFHKKFKIAYAQNLNAKITIKF